jgi:deoxyribose-phosphate aldolase
MRSEDLSKTLDHIVLSPGTTREDIERACVRAREFHVAALSASPRYTRLIAGRLRGTDVKTCAVIGALGGADGPHADIVRAERAVCDGAEELDVLMNLAAMRAGEFGAAREQLVQLVRAVRTRAANDARGTVIVKAIIEAPLLDEAHVRLACKIVADAGADFAMTCSSVGTQVSVDDVELMRESLPEHVGVTASGAVTTVSDVQAMISAGAARIGTACAVDVLEQLRATSGRSQS